MNLMNNAVKQNNVRLLKAPYSGRCNTNVENARTELTNDYTTNPENICALPQFLGIKDSFYRIKNQNYLALPKSINDVSIEDKIYSMKYAFILYRSSTIS